MAALASFAQRFGFGKEEGGGNSIQQEIILESMKEAQESLAKHISDATSSDGNIAAILSRSSISLTPDTNKTQEERLLEQEIEENGGDALLRAIEEANSPEALSQLLNRYEELVQGWSEKASLLRNEKHLKEYVAITAALSMSRRLMQQPELLLGRRLSEQLQNALQSQRHVIEKQAVNIQAKTQQLHEQQQLTKNLSVVETSRQSIVDALKKDAGKSATQELQSNVKQTLQQSTPMQQIQENARTSQKLQAEQTKQSYIQSMQANTAALSVTKAQTSSISPQTTGQIQTAQKQSANQSQQAFLQSTLMQRMQHSIPNPPPIASNSSIQSNTVSSHATEKQSSSSTPGTTEQAPSEQRQKTEETPVKNQSNKVESGQQALQPHTPEHEQSNHRSMNETDLVSKGHVHTGPDCCKGHKHEHDHKHEHHSMNKSDPVTKGCCGGHCNGHHDKHGHEHKEMSKDPVSKGHVHTGPDCCKGHKHEHEHGHKHEHHSMSKTDPVTKGCCGGRCNGHHDKHGHEHKHDEHHHGHKHGNEEHKHKHEHGPSCSCCGKRAKASEASQEKQLGR